MLQKLLHNKVIQNFSYLTIGSVLSQLIGLIVVLKISRIFAPEDYGIYTFIFTQSLLINTIGDLGMRNIIIRAISRDSSRTNDLIYNGLKLRFIASSVLMLFYLIYNHFLGSLNNTQILILFLFAFSGIISNLFENVFLGQQKMLTPSLFNLGFNILWVVIIFALPAVYFSVLLLLIIQLGIGIIKSGILYTIMRKRRILIGKVNSFAKSSNSLLKESWPYFSLMLVMLPTVYLANNFLDINSTKAEIGYFNLSQKLMMPVTMVTGFALSAIFPNLSAIWTKDSQRFYLLVAKGIRFMILSALLLCFLFTLFAKDIVVLLFSASYLPSVEVCQLQVWYVFLMGVNSFIGTVWGAENKEKLILKTAIINAIISTPLLFFGSKYGALGLSYGYVVSFALFEIYLWYKFQKTMPVRIEHSWLIWVIVIILFLISYLMPDNISVLLKLCISLPVIIGLAWHLKINIRLIVNE